jgi:hypothetical protein
MKDVFHTSFFLYTTISRLGCSLDLEIQSIRTANTVTRSTAVFNIPVVSEAVSNSSIIKV